VRPGEYLVGEAPSGLSTEPGVAQLSQEGETRPVAINVDPNESNARRLSAAEFQAAVVHLKDAEGVADTLRAERQEARQHIWQYVLGIMVAMMGLESLVARRVA
jgi:hypothetical protein